MSAPQKVGEATVAQWFEWKDAERRLDIMEDQSAKALKGGWGMTRILVRQEPDLTLEDLGLVKASSIIQKVPNIIESMGR